MNERQVKDVSSNLSFDSPEMVPFESSAYKQIDQFWQTSKVAEK